MLAPLDTYWSDRKIVISGNIVESYRYLTKKIPHGFKPAPHKPKIDSVDPHNEESERISLSRTRKGVRRLINANADDLTKFVTLTFAENLTTVDKANYEFMKFIQRLKAWLIKNHPGRTLKYISVIEFQKRGAVHYHTLFNLPYVKNKQLSEIWGNGFVKINKIDEVTNVGSYVAKYMNKEDERDPRLWGKKMYFTSRNLEKPLEFSKNEEVQILQESMLAGRTPSYLNTFENEHVGTVLYEQYNLKSLGSISS